MPTLTLRRGDDSDFLGRKIRIRLATDMDLVGFKAIVKINCITKEFDDITSKVLVITLNAEETKRLKVNACTAHLKLIEPSGRQGTLSFDLPLTIEPEVVNYASEQ